MALRTELQWAQYAFRILSQSFEVWLFLLCRDALDAHQVKVVTFPVVCEYARKPFGRSGVLEIAGSQVTVIVPTQFDSQRGRTGAGSGGPVLPAPQGSAGHYNEAPGLADANHVFHGFGPMWIVFHDFATDHHIEAIIGRIIILPLADEIDAGPGSNIDARIFAVVGIVSGSSH